ncbi:hypothetical protein Tcan_15517 [Toxocara canis]|uniref:Uncharacterized protein n=1 Tax=Toxocara canis TaxID=6265 RepID=A0A0B2W2L3_TOXCA|nr:hypothetical protein Tcan_15517 [Toxocara canis]
MRGSRPVVVAQLDLPSSPQRYSTDVDKRDIEHALFLTPPNSIAYMLELPRTDRKKLNREMLEQLHTTFAYE